MKKTDSLARAQDVERDAEATPARACNNAICHLVGFHINPCVFSFRAALEKGEQSMDRNKQDRANVS